MLEFSNKYFTKEVTDIKDFITVIYILIDDIYQEVTLTYIKERRNINDAISSKVRNYDFLIIYKGVVCMLVELCSKSQITIPKELVEKLGLVEEDKLDIFEQNQTIYMMSVVVYLRTYLEELREEINEAKAKIAPDEQPVSDNVDALFKKLEK